MRAQTLWCFGILMVAVSWLAGCQSLRDNPPDAAVSPARADAGLPRSADAAGDLSSSAEGPSADALAEADGSAADPDALAAQDGACSPGETRCAPGEEKVQVCTVAGSWSDREACSAICQAGSCAGSCRPGERHCGREQTPELCTSAGSWMAESRCPFVCNGAGVCGGSCLPGSKRCGGDNLLAPEVCDENGRWTAGAAPCAFLCSSGSCGGSCSPGARRCGANQTLEACGAVGTWEPMERCPFVCSQGQCGGECRPGSRRCAGAGTRTPQICDQNGRWMAAGAECENLCSEGVCRGACMPGARRCGTDQAFETCSADGAWQASGRCDFICSGAGACIGECRPGSRRCAGSPPRAESCADDGRWGPAGQGDCCRDADCGTCRVCTSNRCQNAPNGQPGPGCASVASCSSNTAREADRCQSGQCVSGRTQSCAPHGCNGDGCRVCTPRATECTGNTFRTCNADGSGYSVQQSCTHGCNTTSRTCNACSGSSRRCNVDVLETCSGGSWEGMLCPAKQDNFEAGTRIDGTCASSPSPHCTCKPKACTCFDIDSSGTSCGRDGQEHTVNCTSFGADYTCDNAADDGVCVDSSGTRIKPTFCP